MKINDNIRDKKLQYNLNKDTAKTSISSPGKIEKYECLTDEEIIPSNRSQLMQHAVFVYSDFKF